MPKQDLTVVERALVIPDTQIRAPRRGDPEGEWTPALEAVYAYAYDNAPWGHIVHLGDFLDLPYFSRHKDNSETRQQDALEWWGEDAARGAAWLKAFGALSDDCHLLEGNHDFRAIQWAKERPHLQKLVDYPRYVREHGWKWVPYWTEDETVRIGKAEFGHGRYATKYHAEKHARMYLGANFFYGHCHDSQSYSPAVRGFGVTPVSMSCGCLCNMVQPWLHHAHSHNWVHMFMEFHFLSNGKFNFYPIRLYDDKFVSPDGSWVYGGGK